MTNYWVIAPYNSQCPDAFDRVWHHCLERGVICIGWGEVENPGLLDKDALQKKATALFENGRHGFKCLWRLYHEMKPGDVIVARRGRKRIIGVGEVSGEAFYDMDTARRLIDGVRNDNPYPNFLPVKWEEKDIRLNNLTLAMDTVVAWDQRRFDLYLNEPLNNTGVERGFEPVCEVVEEQEFVLEKYLEDFIVSNFKTIFKGELELYRDEEVTGQQYMTAVGPIDILAKDKKTGDYVVIELKKGRPSDHVVGQILRYMGWVQEELADEGQKVRGLVVCKDDDEKMRYALKAIPQTTIDVKLYKVSFSLLDK